MSMKRDITDLSLFLGLLLWLVFCGWINEAPAQNVQCPDRPAGDSSNACANTRWVKTVPGAAGGSNGQIQYNNGGVLGGFTASGDATVNTSTGAVTVNAQTTLGHVCSTASRYLWNSGGTWVCQTLADLALALGLPVPIELYTAGGTSNDTTGVQSAFTACTNAGGCQLICSRGVTYTIDTVNYGSNTYVNGGGCIFQQRTSSNSIFTGTTVSNVLFEKMTLLATTPTVNTVALFNCITTCNNIRVINSRFKGSATVDTGLSTPTGGANAIEIETLTAVTTSTNIQVEGNYFYRFNFIPVRIYATQNLKVSGNVFQSNAFGVYMTGTSRYAIVGNVFDTCVMYATSPSTSQFCIAIASESTQGHSLGVTSRGTVSGNLIYKYGYAQGILVHAGSFISITGNSCEETGICISLNPASNQADDVISNVSVTGNQSSGATSLSTFPSSADTGIVVKSGPGPNVNITNVVVSGNVLSSHNRVAGDAAVGCINVGYADYVVVTNNVLTSCGANSIVVDSPVVGLVVSANVMDNTITKGGENNGLLYATGATGAQSNTIGNHFKTMTNGIKYATGISTANIQVANSLCISVTNCTIGP